MIEFLYIGQDDTHLTIAFVIAGHVAVVLGGRAVGWRPSLRQPLRPLLLAWAAIALFSAVAFDVAPGDAVTVTEHELFEKGISASQDLTSRVA